MHLSVTINNNKIRIVFTGPSIGFTHFGNINSDRPARSCRGSFTVPCDKNVLTLYDCFWPAAAPEHSGLPIRKSHTLSRWFEWPLLAGCHHRQLPPQRGGSACEHWRGGLRLDVAYTVAPPGLGLIKTAVYSIEKNMGVNQGAGQDSADAHADSD